MAFSRSGRARTLIALMLVLVVLGISPRALLARSPQTPRGQGTRRPHPPRNVLPERAFEVVRTPRTAQDTARQHVVSLERPAGLATPSLPARAITALSKPVYLRLDEAPHHQTSPPA